MASLYEALEFFEFSTLLWPVSLFLSMFSSLSLLFHVSLSLSLYGRQWSKSSIYSLVLRNPFIMTTFAWLTIPTSEDSWNGTRWAELRWNPYHTIPNQTKPDRTGPDQIQIVKWAPFDQPVLFCLYFIFRFSFGSLWFLSSFLSLLSIQLVKASNEAISQEKGVNQ